MVPFFGGGVTHLGGPAGHRMQNVHFSTHLQQLRGYSAFTDLIKNQSIGGPQGTLHTLVWIFRWFKFTLWDISHWTSFVKFGLKTA